MVSLLVTLILIIISWVIGVCYAIYKYKLIGKVPDEYIIAAAILVEDWDTNPNLGQYPGDYYRTALRHDLILLNYKEVSRKSIHQGFITNKLEYVSREQAARIAYKAGQIDVKKKVLYSEDLWYDHE